MVFLSVTHDLSKGCSFGRSWGHDLGVLRHLVDEGFECYDREDDTNKSRSLPARSRMNSNHVDCINRNAKEQSRFQHRRRSV